MLLDLPDVTIVVISNIEMALTRLALRDSLQQIKPSCVHIWTDQVIDWEFEGVELKLFDVKINNSAEASNVLWYRTPWEIETSHLLTIQWDGWVLNSSMWHEEYLKADYIGAPWPWHKEKRIGNGGFSLRSTKMMRYLGGCDLEAPEDDYLCRYLRPELESQGFHWASEALAYDFSFERQNPRNSFGFHGGFNFTKILTNKQLEYRLHHAGTHAMRVISPESPEEQLRA